MKTTKDTVLLCGVTFIGIANSVELFSGELTASKSQLSSTLICRREEKIIFSPYTRAQVTQILTKLFHEYLIAHFSSDKHQALKEQLIHNRAIELIAMKVDKMSGDLRQAFEILRSTINKKAQLIQSDEATESFTLTYEDANRTLNEIFQSKTAGIIKKVPRSHTILLIVIEDFFRFKQVNAIEFKTLLDLYNKRA